MIVIICKYSTLFSGRVCKGQVEFGKDSRDSLKGHLAMFPMNSRYPRPCTYLSVEHFSYSAI